jgi:hypothetical protein
MGFFSGFRVSAQNSTSFDKEAGNDFESEGRREGESRDERKLMTTSDG